MMKIENQETQLIANNETEDSVRESTLPERITPFETGIAEQSVVEVRPVDALTKIQESFSIGSVETNKWGRYNGPRQLSDVRDQKPPWFRDGTHFQGSSHFSSTIELVRNMDPAVVGDVFQTSESENLEKFAIQGLKPLPFWLVDSFSVRQDVDAELIREGVDLFFQYVELMTGEKELGMKKVLEISDPLTTNKGAPIHSPDVAELIELIGDCSNLYIDPSSDEIELFPGFVIPKSTYNILEAAFDKRDENVITFGCSRVGRRTGPNRKPRLLYEQVGNAIEAKSEVTPYMRDRHVYMVPYLYNIGLAPIYGDYIRYVSILPEFNHNEDNLAEFKRALSSDVDYATIHEADISGMDRTYPEDLSLAVFDRMSKLRGNGYSKIPSLFAKQMHRMGVIMPDIFERDHPTAGLILTPRHPVGRYSGSKLTTAFNSIGHAAAHMVAFLQAGIITRNDVTKFKDQMIIKIQGDDVLMVMKKGGNRSNFDRYLEILPGVMNGFGFETEVFPGNTFLMRHYDDSGYDHPVISRVIQQTLSPEHQKTDGRVQLIGQAARSMGWRTFPAALQDYKEQASSVIAHYSSTLSEITELSDKEKRELIVILGTELAQSQKGLKQLTDYVIDNRFSRSGIELLDAIAGTELFDIVMSEFDVARQFYMTVRRAIGPMEED